MSPNDTREKGSKIDPKSVTYDCSYNVGEMITQIGYYD